ncbi:hypothetical protein J6590_037676 [Homalodisca vitripennis]|nr:hypothetical protein J6590_037676 [Homalodisca vitripennis]
MLFSFQRLFDVRAHCGVVTMRYKLLNSSLRIFVIFFNKSANRKNLSPYRESICPLEIGKSDSGLNVVSRESEDWRLSEVKAVTRGTAHLTRSVPSLRVTSTVLSGL